MEKLIEQNLNIVDHLVKDEKWDEAEIILNGILSIRPDSLKALQVYGMILYIQKRYEEAVEIALKAMEIDETNFENYNNLNLCYLQLHQIDKSREILLKALKYDPDNLGFNLDLSFAYFLNGEWEKGWKLDEYRIKYLENTPVYAQFYSLFDIKKRWNGIDSLEGKKIIAYCEQGFGDFIQHVRFIPKLKELGAEVYIFTQENLFALFENLGTLISTPLDVYDYNCSVMSLPHLLNISVEQCVGKPYLYVEEKFNLTEYKDNFKIGITWSGNPAFSQNHLRCCQPSDFQRLSEMNNVKLFSLQKDMSVENTNIINMSEYMTDFKETAKIIQAMDLIITVDTSILHLAGALGKETWAMIYFVPCGRWKIKGDKTPWYDSVTLFRQEELKNWNTVFAKIENKLNEYMQVN